MRHHLRRAAAAIAAANDEDLLLLRGTEEPAGSQRASRDLSPVRATHEAADRAGRQHRGARPAPRTA